VIQEEALNSDKGGSLYLGAVKLAIITFLITMASFFGTVGLITFAVFSVHRSSHQSALNGKRTKTARAQGKKVQITVEQERSRWIWQLLLSCLFDQNVLKGYMTFMSSIDAEY